MLFALVGLAVPACPSRVPATDPGDGAPVESDTPVADVVPATYSKASQEVIDVVRSGEHVPVIVSLNATPPEGDDLEAAGATIAAAQQRLLNDLHGHGWVTRIAFENVPALAGTIRAESALALLDRHPDVSSVDLDSSGDGDGGGGSARAG